MSKQPVGEAAVRGAVQRSSKLDTQRNLLLWQQRTIRVLAQLHSCLHVHPHWHPTCGTMPTALRSECCVTDRTSCPSSRTAPLDTS